MKEKSKAILGQWINNRLSFSDDEKKMIIEDCLSGNETKKSLKKSLQLTDEIINRTKKASHSNPHFHQK